MGADMERVSSRILMKIGEIDNAISMGIISNSQREKKEKEVSKITNLLTNLAIMQKTLSILRRDMEVAAAQYRESRQNILQSEAKKVLDVIFPEEDFQVMIDWDVQRDKPVANLLLGQRQLDGEITWFPPKQCNGEFVKQLVAFVIISRMNYLMGAQVMFADECLNSGDSESLQDSKYVLDKICEYIQMICIEHKDAYYTGVSRREIRMLKHRAGDIDRHSGWLEILSQKKVLPDNGDEVASQLSLELTDKE